MRAEAAHTNDPRTTRYGPASPAYALQPVTPNTFRLPNSRRRLGCIADRDAGTVTLVDPVTCRVVEVEPIEPPERVAA